jgi:menaquinone-9 beta-reductase
MQTRDHDAIVVGAGPAGSVAAGLLADRGHRVLLLDRDTFPRDKPCGESLNPGAVAELDRLGVLEAVRRLPHQTLVRWRIHARNGRSFEGAFDRTRYGIALARGPFDALLLDQARTRGADLMTGARVDDLVHDRGAVVGVRLQSGDDFHAPLVIGADGLRSVVVRRLGLLQRRPRLRKVALTAHVSGAELPQGTGVLGLFPWGCAGVVRTSSETANVAVVLDRSAARTIAGDPAGAFDRFSADIPWVRGARRRSAVLTTGPFDWPTRAVTAAGVLLVGDAAGYFDPFTGQGIFRALRGARLVADVGDARLRDGRLTRDALQEYERRHRDEFTSATRLQRIIETGVARPAIFGAVVALLGVWPSLADRLVAVTGDLEPVRSLILPGASRRA